MRSINTVILGLSLTLSSVALAGRGATTVGIEAAIASGSVDTIVAELERAEILACLACIAPIRKLTDHPSAKVRDAAGWWLGRRGIRDAVTADMIGRLGAQDPIAARNAADVLGGMRESSALPALSAYVKAPLDEDSGAAAARAIGSLGSSAGAAPLLQALTVPLAGVRLAALQALRNLRAPKGQSSAMTAGATIPLLTDSDETVRREAAYTTGFAKDRMAINALANTLAFDQSARVRKAAAWALGEVGGGADALLAAQSDPDMGVRSIATGALGRLK
jgi:HEAT repeat protein